MARVRSAIDPANAFMDDVITHQQTLEPDHAANHLFDHCRRSRRRLGGVKCAKHNMCGHRHRQVRQQAETRQNRSLPARSLGASTTGSLKWVSAVARPWPGMCLSTGKTPPSSRPSVTARAMAATLPVRFHRPGRRSRRRRRAPAHPPTAGNRRSRRHQQDRRRSAGRSTARRRARGRFDVVEPAKYRSGRIDWPVAAGRSAARGRPPGRSGSAHPARPTSWRNSTSQMRYLRRRFNIPLKQNKAPGALRADEFALGGVQLRSGNACDEGPRVHGGRLARRYPEGQGKHRQFLWMTHCPPADFKLPQNCEASSEVPNGPTMAR